MHIGFQYLVFILLIALISITAQAMQMTPLRVENIDNEYRIPLGWLNNRSHMPIELYGANARRVVKLPLAERLQIEDERLEMVYTNSISLLPRSQLAVTLNERVVAQLPVNPQQPNNSARITFDFSHLQAGYHDLGFRAAQHYIDECEDPSAPELYSQIDAIDSYVSFTAHRKPIKPSLAQLSDIFDSRLWMDRYRLQLLVPPDALATEPMRQAAAQLSQYIASKFEFIPVSVQLTELPANFKIDEQDARHFPGVALSNQSWDGIVFGTREQLAPYIAQEILENITEGYIGVDLSDQDPTRFIVLVSGTTPDEVKQAATVLNLPGLALPDRYHVRISDLQMDTGYQRRLPLQTDRGWINFAQLGFRSTTLRGMYPGSVGLTFWSIQEMLDPARPFVNIQLHYAYGSGFDRKSALNVFLNDQFIQALPLQDIRGGQVYRDPIRVPTVALQPGINSLRFEPTVIGVDVGGVCVPIFTDHLHVSIFEDSRIEMPPIADFMRLPDLELFAQTGLPYTRFSDGKGVGVLVGDMRLNTLSSALTLIAKLRQVHGAPLTALRFPALEDSLDEFDSLIVVGAVDHLPEQIGRQMTAFMPRLRWQSIQVGSFKTQDNNILSWLQSPLTQINQPATATITFREGLGDSTALVQFHTDHGVPVTVLTAADHQRLERGTQRLTEFETWPAVTGAGFMWNADGTAHAVAEAVNYFTIGQLPSKGRMNYYMSTYTWQTMLALASFIVFFVMLTWFLLRRRAHKIIAMDE